MQTRLAFLASGAGTNMENLVRHIRDGKIQAEPVMVITDNPEAGAIQRAKSLGVSVVVVGRSFYDSKVEFEKQITDFILANRIDWIILAGFMRVLSKDFVNRFLGKIINIHPSLLPQFPGAHAIKDAFEAQVKETGVTTHFVIPEVDAGPIILQKKVPVNPFESMESLEAKIHAVEYEIYPETLKLLLAGKAQFKK